MKDIMKTTKKDKKLIFKLISILSLILVILTVSLNSFAYSVGDKVVAKEKTEVPTLMKFGDMYIMCSIAEIEKDGKKYFAYCLDPKKNGVETYGKYNLTISKKITNDKIYSVLLHGYPNKTPKELGVNTAGEAYLATTQAIYTLMLNRNVNQYSGVDSVAGKRTYEAYKKIVANAKNNPYVKPDLNISIESISDWSLSEDKIYLEKELKVNSNTSTGKYNLNVNNNTIGAEILNNNKIKKEENVNIVNEDNTEINEILTLRIPIKSLNEIGSLNIQVDTTESSNIAYEAVPSNSLAQRLAIIGIEEILKAENNINIEYYKNETKLEILKIDEETNEVLDSVTFNIYNEKEELIYENLVTDKEGKILIENLLPGKYIIKEIATKDRYVLLEKEIEVNVEFNKITSIKIENKKEEIPEVPEIIKKVPKKVLPQTGY